MTPFHLDANTFRTGPNPSFLESYLAPIASFGREHRLRRTPVSSTWLLIPDTPFPIVWSPTSWCATPSALAPNGGSFRSFWYSCVPSGQCVWITRPTISSWYVPSSAFVFFNARDEGRRSTALPEWMYQLLLERAERARHIFDAWQQHLQGKRRVRLRLGIKCLRGQSKWKRAAVCLAQRQRRRPYSHRRHVPRGFSRTIRKTNEPEAPTRVHSKSCARWRDLWQARDSFSD